MEMAAMDSLLSPTRFANQISPEADARPAAYVVDDGTRMIEIAPHQYVNRCAFNRQQHNWQRRGKDLVCKGLRPRCCRSPETGVIDMPSLREAALEFLTERFPKCFDLNNPRPLKIGIAFDIVAAAPPEISWLAITLALDSLTKSQSYLARVVAGEPRIGLDGEPAGVVTPNDEAYAMKRLAHLAQAKQEAGARLAQAAQEASAHFSEALNPPPAPRKGDGFEGLRRAARARGK
jgi:hypothetical protein